MNHKEHKAHKEMFFVFFVFFVSFVVHGQSRVAELNDKAWKALKDGYNDRAAAMFNEALSIQPDNPLLLLGAGAVLHAQGRQQDAMARLQRALDINPRLTPAARLLGQIAYAEGDTALAIKAYEIAVKAAPNDAEVASELAAVRRDADTHRTFEDRRFERFRVMFEGHAEAAIAAHAMRVFDSVFWKIGEKLGEHPQATIVAVLYTEKQFRDITRAPEWSAGQYDGRIRIPVSGAERNPDLFEQVLTHELAHAVIANIAPTGVPNWLHEGLAQYFDGSDRREAAQRMKSVRQPIPLQVLERGFGRLNALQASVAYDESLLAVGVMLDRPGFGWIRLLHRLAEGQTFDEAISAFGFAYADLEAPFSR